jgi:hypothetical protein
MGNISGSTFHYFSKNISEKKLEKKLHVSRVVRFIKNSRFLFHFLQLVISPQLHDELLSTPLYTRNYGIGFLFHVGPWVSEYV